MAAFLTNDRSSPWANLWARDFDQLFSEMDKMLEPFRTTRLPMTQLSCDMHETDTSYLLSVDIPGVPKEDIHIEIVDRSLQITAERKQEKSLNDVTLHRQERSFGTIKRVISLPEGIDPESIQASCENGVLYLSIAKSETAKPKKIEISSGKSGFFQKLKDKALDVKAKTVNS